jgi:hypothetical protein|tara:strand:- start:1396 stop:1629 length:234 start_codon:yes stop_codon:yes gene_type:complete
MLEETLYQKCIEFIKKDEVKNEIKLLMKPLVDIVIQEFYPYIYLSLLFVIISFFLILGIFVLLWKNRSIPNKNIQYL